MLNTSQQQEDGVNKELIDIVLFYSVVLFLIVDVGVNISLETHEPASHRVMRVSGSAPPMQVSRLLSWTQLHLISAVSAAAVKCGEIV